MKLNKRPGPNKRAVGPLKKKKKKKKILFYLIDNLPSYGQQPITINVPW
jgi:hypothetical protein